MPLLKDNREIKTIELEDIKGGSITLYTSFLARDIEALTNAKDRIGIIVPITLLAKEWNLEDEKGVVLPITKENVGLLSLKDLEKIIKELNFGNDFLAQEDTEKIG